MEHTIRELDWSLQRLSLLSVAPPLNSRLHRARKILSEADLTTSAFRRNTPQRRIFAEAQRTAVEFYGIARSINPRASPLPEASRDKFFLFYGGADDPADDSDVTAIARNIQFELWLAAWLTAGGKPIRQAEPDLQLAYRFEWRGVAAKRVRSRRHVRRRVTQAARQVKRNTGTGFVALSLDNYSTVRAIKARSDLAGGEKFFKSYPEIQRAGPAVRSRKFGRPSPSRATTSPSRITSLTGSSSRTQ